MPAGFADGLSYLMEQGQAIRGAGFAYTYVSREVHPFRTRESCLEDGQPGDSRGYMDLLLSSVGNGLTLPAVGEIKSVNEYVGPTYALVQTLMCASMLATPNQGRRVINSYSNQQFHGFEPDNPRLDLVIIMEHQEYLNAINPDLHYALTLAHNLQPHINQHVRDITFLLCTIANNQITATVARLP